MLNRHKRFVRFAPWAIAGIFSLCIQATLLAFHAEGEGLPKLMTQSPEMVNQVEFHVDHVAEQLTLLFELLSRFQ